MASRATSYSDYYKNSSNPQDSTPGSSLGDRDSEDESSIVDPAIARKKALQRRLKMKTRTKQNGTT